MDVLSPVARQQRVSVVPRIDTLPPGLILHEPGLEVRKVVDAPIDASLQPRPPPSI
ncbi:MAG: hypothetical protein GYB33_03080 [Gammaproteobacteria bacterium]|uniref:hypothetical protein n=1 Tax=Pseudomaricurvus alcaniphilus TaxID=1166482 RepID=UPI0014083AD0|nr:hypothetical protein [Pseudomaricurvus alcaniphilus]MBR9909320.1 hypothetical protein [Gammaproteobacteria bacterium]NHN38256.1 hypothetical protein [Pseudomaricurvus alcaniphilus]